MSTHPNVILLADIAPEHLSRKTANALRGSEDPHEKTTIGGVKYYVHVMESDYDEDWQISAKEGHIVVFHLVTYGYGESVVWYDLERHKDALEEWCRNHVGDHHFSYTIRVTANYW